MAFQTQCDIKYYIVKLTVFMLIKVLFEYFSTRVLRMENLKVRNDTERNWILCVALTVAVACVFYRFYQSTKDLCIYILNPMQIQCIYILNPMQSKAF